MLTYDEFWANLSEVKNESLSEFNDYLLKDCRSSTIFPVYKTKDSATRLEFLAYWVKKHGNNVVIRLTARNLGGEVLRQQLDALTTYRAMTIDSSPFFEKYNIGFCGSIEVEVFSKSPPLYTYPAITISFEAKHSHSVVHSCIRTYNSNEQVTDYAMQFPQTGFDVALTPNNKNYICFFGGDKKNYKLYISLIEGDFKKDKSVSLNNQRYGQTHLVYIEDLLSSNDLKVFKAPKVSIEHDLDDVFPRFYAGIINREFVPTITHTFFDTSKASSKIVDSSQVSLRAVNTADGKYFDTAVIIPVYPTDKFKTTLRSYGQNLKFSGEAELRFYAHEGELLFSRALSAKEVESFCGVAEFDVSNEVVCAKLLHNKSYSIFLGFVGQAMPFPIRFKLGLNVRKVSAELGSNICFSPWVLEKNTLSKPFSRRWFPLGGRQNFVASVHNTDLLIINTVGSSKFSFEFVSNIGQTLKREIFLKSNSSLFLDIDSDDDLKALFGDEVGWCLVTAETYLVDAYYFSTSGHQIGGDHAY